LDSSSGLAAPFRTRSVAAACCMPFLIWLSRCVCLPCWCRCILSMRETFFGVCTRIDWRPSSYLIYPILLPIFLSR
jgi:hypothetical protein